MDNVGVWTILCVDMNIYAHTRDKLSPSSYLFIFKALCTPQTVNCRDIAGRLSTPLHFASGYNRMDIVEHLLRNGADVHAKDKG